ncbi:hypothetical protein [Cohaesibacter celericrescens]|uniref:hypothetical protein n=1 Tax=Cohaesibacter celericrescens TaxID=2067669 RepID=UPI0015E0AAD0|nr:hypothetical protein [Cohaesibacter celericrescens]
MSEQNRKPTPQDDLLEKEYHKIGISAVAAASCVKKHVEEKHTDYDPHINDK